MIASEHELHESNESIYSKAIFVLFEIFVFNKISIQSTYSCHSRYSCSVKYLFKALIRVIRDIRVQLNICSKHLFVSFEIFVFS